jgi:hypothetical protein
MLYAQGTAQQGPGQALPTGGSAPVPPATGLVAGRIIDATGAPIGAATVAISGVGRPAASQPPRVLSDSEGRYFFGELPAGNYSLTATKPGWLGGAFGRRWWGGASVPIELAADERRGNVDVTLWKGGVISGRVTDEAGEPMVHVDVRVAQTKFVAGHRQATFGLRVLTDDRGVYRFPSLSPGDYLVVVPVGVLSHPTTFAGQFDHAFLQTMTTIGAAPLQIESGTVAVSGGKALFTSLLSMPFAPPVDGVWQTYATTFYPSTAGIGSATTVRVGAGEERSAINIAMHPTPTFPVSGRVTGPDGPAAGYAVHLVPAESADAPLFDTATAVTDGHGDFTLLGVPTGRYVARVVRVPWPAQEGWRFAAGNAGGNTPKTIGMSTNGPGSSSGPPTLPTEPLLFADQTVVVGDRAVKDVALALRPGIHISGRVAYQGTTAPEPTAAELHNTSIQIEPANGQQFGTVLPGQFSADGQFTTQSLWPGRYLIRVAAPPRGWAFKSATSEGRNVAETPIDITTDLDNVVITFTDHPAMIDGTVTADQGQPVIGSLVLLFPVEPATWMDFGRSSRRINQTPVLASGTFRIPAPPAGEYFLVAVADQQGVEYQNPAFLAKAAAVAERIQVREDQPISKPLTLRRVQ